MKSDRTQRRPNIILCVGCSASHDRADFDRSRRRGRRRWFGWPARAIWRPSACNWALANPVSPICLRRRGRSTSAIPTSPTQSCAPRSASTFPVSPMAKRASSPWPGTGENRRHPSLGRARRWRVVEPAQYRHPRQPNSCARTRSSSPGQRIRRRPKRRSISRTALSTIRRLPELPGASISISNGSGGAPGGGGGHRRILQAALVEG